MRTKTCHKTLDPEWTRHFDVPVTDVFQTVKITIYDEDDGGASSLIL